MLDLSTWLNRFSAALDTAFGSRVWFVGLQGSYGRGEATDTSDIDVVVILDALSTDDIRAYGALLDTLPHRELICGFLSGKEELLHWDAADLFQFYHDTKPLKGSLDPLLKRLDQTAVERAIHTGVCNLYHACVHNMLHEKSRDVLRSLYKSAVFTVQAVCFQQSGQYHAGRDALLSAAGEAERPILQTAYGLKDGVPVEFEAMSETLFRWAQRYVQQDGFRSNSAPPEGSPSS